MPTRPRKDFRQRDPTLVLMAIIIVLAVAVAAVVANRYF
jgi:hypothetical protein